MKQPVLIAGAIAAVIVIVIAVGLSAVLQPGSWVRPQEAPGYTGLVPASKLLRVPVTGIYPGGTPTGLQVDMKNPLAGDPDAVVRGMRDFDTFNCSGCHMANAGGGMGPALSNAKWLYRDSAANIYLDIAQGRSAGMPAFGAMLPDRTIWELVAYIQSISHPKPAAFGTTTPAPQPVEQVPAGQVKSPTPWAFTEPVPPNGERNGAGDQPPDAPLPPGAQQAPQPGSVVSAE
jgi:cytochrome c oxidase cbb3-type subunit 3